VTLGIILIIIVFLVLNNDGAKEERLYFFLPFVLFYIKELFFKPFTVKRVGKVIFYKEFIEIIHHERNTKIKLENLISLKVMYQSHSQWKGSRMKYKVMGNHNIIEIGTKISNYKFRFLSRNHEDKVKIRRICYSLHHRGYKVVYSEKGGISRKMIMKILPR
jgi:hypothetical protein